MPVEAPWIKYCLITHIQRRANSQPKLKCLPNEDAFLANLLQSWHSDDSSRKQ